MPHSHVGEGWLVASESLNSMLVVIINTECKTCGFESSNRHDVATSHKNKAPYYWCHDQDVVHGAHLLFMSPATFVILCAGSVCNLKHYRTIIYGS